jgi:hypothetical protein
LLAELERIGAPLKGGFSLDALVGPALTLRDQTEALAARIEAAGPAETILINDALMKVSRALVPVDYSRGDRFDHDPALPQNPWPALDPIRVLGTLEAGSDAARFATVAAMRARNRVAAALRTANAALDGALAG